MVLKLQDPAIHTKYGVGNNAQGIRNWPHGLLLNPHFLRTEGQGESLGNDKIKSKKLLPDLNLLYEKEGLATRQVDLANKHLQMGAVISATRTNE